MLRYTHMERTASCGANLRLLLLLLMIGAPSTAESQSAIALHGSWRATAGARTFQGTWTAKVDPKTPNLAQGEWTLLGENRVTLQGTWAAEKQGTAWRGTWAARVAPGRGTTPPMTGTWQATVKDPAVKTLADMLHAALAQVDGIWRHGQMSGSWSIVRAAQ